MKPKLSKFSIAVLFMFIAYTPSECQEWNWKWAESVTSQNTGTFPGQIECDFLNNYYEIAVYHNTLALPDTTYYHSGQFMYSYNCNAVLKYNTLGEYLKALDFYVDPDGSLFYSDIGLDKEQNLYISFSFSQTLFIQDSTYDTYYWQCPMSPDGLDIKLNKEFEIQWAEYIGSCGQDNIWQNTVTENGDIYLNTNHYVNEFGTQVIFFDQDSIFSEKEFSTICKLDKDGKLKWLLDFYGIIGGSNLELGNDGKLFWWGSASTDIIYNQDTTFFPTNYPYYNCNFCATITQDGILEDIRFLVNKGLLIWNYEVNETGEKYFNGSVLDTVIFMGDTTIIPNGSYYRIIGKLNNQFEPLWYHIISKATSNQDFGVIKLALDENNLIFSIGTDEYLQIADTVLPIYYGYEAFVGEFDTDGSLLHILHHDCPLKIS
jgi:hypothetical protein